MTPSNSKFPALSPRAKTRWPLRRHMLTIARAPRWYHRQPSTQPIFLARRYGGSGGIEPDVSISPLGSGPATKPRPPCDDQTSYLRLSKSPKRSDLSCHKHREPELPPIP